MAQRGTKSARAQGRRAGQEAVEGGGGGGDRAAAWGSSTTCSALLEPNRAELGHKVAAPKNFYLAQTIALWSKLLQGFFKELYASGNDDHSFLQMCFFIVSFLTQVFFLFKHFRLYLKISIKCHLELKIHNFSD